MTQKIEANETGNQSGLNKLFYSVKQISILMPKEAKVHARISQRQCRYSGS